jgi:CHAD domain-containing protein
MHKTLARNPFLNFLAAALPERLTALDAALVQVQDSDAPEAVHQARVATRRLRSALALLSEARPRKKYKRWRRQTKAITQALGDLRDTDVQLLFVKERLQTPEAALDLGAGLEYLQGRLEQKRAKFHRQARRAIRQLRRRETLEAMAATWASWLAENGASFSMDPAVRDQAKPLILARFNNVVRPSSALPTAEEADELHRLRIAWKRLRYTLEIFAPAFAGQLELALGAVKDLQKLLGDIHDADVWITRLPKLIAKQENGNRTGLSALLEDRAQKQRRLHAQLFERWQELEQAGTWKKLRELLE